MTERLQITDEPVQAGTGYDFPYPADNALQTGHHEITAPFLITILQKQQIYDVLYRTINGYRSKMSEKGEYRYNV